MSTTITGKNQVTIPADLVREMGLEPGTQLEWLKGDLPGVIIVKVEPSIRQRLAEIRAMGAEHKRNNPGRDLIAELIAEREREDIEEYGPF
jgi:bifunctional DNA-binding transcriptional regulator/antitoxin component of YhaV-PrlF toxin-antitoxin module